MDAFEIELKMGFLEEASQLLADAEQCFLGLESNPDDMNIIEKIFRLAHNLKGSSKAVGFDQLGSFTHEFESFFLKIKNKQITVTPAVISLLLRCNDQIKHMVDALKEDLGKVFELDSLVAELQSASQGNVPVAETQPETQPEDPAEVAPTTEEVIAASEIELLKVNEEQLPQMLEEVTMTELRRDHLEFAQAEAQKKIEEINAMSVAPVVPIKTPAASPAAAPAAASKATTAQSDESIRVSLGRLEKLINFVGELSILQTVLQEQIYGSNTMLVRKTTQQLGKVCKEVQDISMSLRMIPVKQTFQKMQRIVRDTSSALGKKVNLILEGEDTELDKTVLESIGDPLVHLIRNAVDHGIEHGEDRIKAGKPETGTVWLRAFHQSGKLVMEVQDDGGGINGQKLVGKAIEKGILKPGTVMQEKDAVKLIFHPGFSTKAQVSEVSGRGVGMDVVKTNIEQLQGEVTINTEVGKGTTLRIELPLTLAIIDGMVIEDCSERFIVPLAQIHETVKPAEGELHNRTGVGEVLQLRGEIIPTFRLSSLIHKSSAKKPKNTADQIAMIFRLNGTPFAVLVDDIIRQQQVVVKQLGPELKNIKGYSGSAILGDGKPALILELQDLTSMSNKSHITSQMNQRGVA